MYRNMSFITCLKHYSQLNFQITLSISDCKTLYSFLACWISILILFFTWLNCWSRAWWELWSCASSWNEQEDKHLSFLTHPIFRKIKHVKWIIFDRKTRPFDSLSPGPWFSAPKIYACFQHYVSDSSSPLLPASASSQGMNTEEANQPKIKYYIHTI